ncbi:MAG: hypothetical protein QXJ56_06445 [Ignisphaera sp.]
MAIVKTTSCSGCINELVYCLTSDPQMIKIYRVDFSPEFVDGDIPDEIDILFVEGSISNNAQEKLLVDLRKRTRIAIAIGTCAVMGGIQSLRSGNSIDDVKSYVYPEPNLVDVYSDVKPVDQVIQIDLSFPGCPVNRLAIASFLKKFSLGGLPIPIYESVCGECKRKNIACVMVSKGMACLGPITVNGCGAICPSFNRGCYGCYGIKSYDIDAANFKEFINVLLGLGMDRSCILTLVKGYSFKLLKNSLVMSYREDFD